MTTGCSVRAAGSVGSPRLPLFPMRVSAVMLSQPGLIGPCGPQAPVSKRIHLCLEASVFFSALGALCVSALNVCFNRIRKFT